MPDKRSPTEARRRFPKLFNLSILDSPFCAEEFVSIRDDISLAGVGGRVPLLLLLWRPQLPKLNMLLRFAGEYLTSFLNGLCIFGAEGGSPLIDLRFASRTSADVAGLGRGTRTKPGEFSSADGRDEVEVLF
jgi:hypothetical protein